MTTLWDRSRQVAVQAILDTALRLFSEQGYERTTIAQIARESGISQRSLFRYFGTKEDLVCGDQQGLGELLKRVVQEQPAEVSAWDALRAGFEAVLAEGNTTGQALELSRLIFDTPSLRSRYVEKRLRWQAELLPIITERLEADSGPDAELHARAIIATVFACVDTATELWVRSDGRLAPGDLYDRCLAAVRGRD
jgi:AcrR family transcriptional regulator